MENALSAPGMVDTWILLPHVDGVCRIIGILFTPEGIPLPAGPGATSSEDAAEDTAPRRCLIVRISCSIHLNDMRMSFSATSVPVEAESEV